ncbi:hypothetical protein B296_00032152 [Ensete ventricosum]|uniref:DUF538 domain-containing protein n=1 Tax=Ensete ventricosum TaxID=4639 RepID=A0A426ZXV9_ENSVE|nr:hypothetical protein B296_00032152 [Ensete ventricosum]
MQWSPRPFSLLLGIFAPTASHFVLSCALTCHTYDVVQLSLTSASGLSYLYLSAFIRRKIQKPLPELLREYDMPIGLFPQDATHYEFIEETGKLTVYIPSICEVGYRDSSVLRFLTIVTGYLEKGKLVDIEGIKTKVLIWAKVNSIGTEGSKVHFTTGMKKTRSRDAYEVLRGGITVDKF